MYVDGDEYVDGGRYDPTLTQSQTHVAPGGIGEPHGSVFVTPANEPA